VKPRQGDCFPLDQSRVAYLRFLRRGRRSLHSEADADFQRAKCELIRLRIAEKQRELIPLEEAAVGHMDRVVGLFITRLSVFAPRCGGRDLAARRSESLRRLCTTIFSVAIDNSSAAAMMAGAADR
jgi:hypothetical protein